MPPVERTAAEGTPQYENRPKAYWRSLEERADAPEFQEMVRRSFHGREWASLPPATRRGFLKLMGASVALAGLAGCRWPREEIVPFSRPADYTPGIPLHYSTSMEIGGVASGLLVTSYGGRPIKIEGNPGHPINIGATSAIQQAAVLELYDPDRSRSLSRREATLRSSPTWDEFRTFAREKLGLLRENGGAGLRILSEASSSLSLDSMRRHLLEVCPLAVWVEYEPITRDAEREGARLAYGEPLRALHRLNRAKTIACFDADPLMEHPASLLLARQFAAGRRAEDGTMNRLFVVESDFSITGTMADHRLARPRREIPRLLGMLARDLAERHRLELPPGALGAPAEGVLPPMLRTLADDLMLHRGESVLLIGPGQPAEVHALGHALNAALGNVGTTIEYVREPHADRPGHVEALAGLMGDICAGAVDTLVILGGNPVYDAPADLEFAEVLEHGVETTIHLSLFENETSRHCRWSLPRAHVLESWGDGRAWDGTICVVQPLIEPLYGGKTPAEALSILLDDPQRDGHEISREALRPHLPVLDFESAWRRLLHDGVLPGSAFETVRPSLRAGSLPTISVPEPAGGDRIEISFRADHAVHDGRFADNGWLQELPDPVSKLTWGNAALLAPRTAERLGVRSEDEIAVATGGRSIEIPVYVLPGHAEGSITIPLGYGRDSAGRVGDGVGVDAYRIRTTGTLYSALADEVRRTGGRHRLASTQDHHAIDLTGRRGVEARLGELVREADLATYRDHPDFAKHVVHHPPLVSLWKEIEFEGHAWGMAIDLTACIGCGACAVACQAENNVPIVGKEQVIESREMHWLRIDRYFSGDPDQPNAVHQPMACVHCWNAPCEAVCPVTATVHSEEGLNQMVYNRCIGTRYCANNCPYKVRRFNWFDFNKEITPIERMVKNPEVTVRSRGVMEKCTYCVQRIEAVKIRAKNQRRPIADGEIVPACAQACPTEAIVFGDLSDPESRVRKLHDHDRAYGLLAELNTQPRTLYLAKLRNPAERAGSHKAGEGTGHE